MAREQVFAAQPLASALGRVVVAPFQWYLHGEEFLRVTGVNSVAGVTIKLVARTLGADPAVQVSRLDVTPASDRSVFSRDMNAGTGALLSASVFVAVGAPLVGQTFVAVQLLRGSGTAAEVLATLFSGYITANQAMSWPGSPVVPSTTGEPVVRKVIGTAPSVNASILETVPTNARWELLSLEVDLTNTDAVSHTVTGFLQIADPGIRYLEIPPSTSAFTVPNGVTFRVQWGQGLTQFGPGTLTQVVSELPSNYRLPAGTQIFLPNPGAFMQWSAAHMVVREWQEFA